MERERLIALAKEKRRAELVEKARAKFQLEQEERAGQLGTADEPEPTLGEQVLSAGGTALDYGLRGLDYAGGLTRTAASEAIDAGVDGNKVTYEDWLAALKGQAPTTADYMERMGLPEGESVTVPFVGDISARDVAGFTGDVLLDPLTYATFGASAVGKLGKAGKVASKGLTATSDLTKGAGKKLYTSGFKKVDEGLIEKGVKPLSEVLWENGKISGTNKSIAAKTEKLNKKLLGERNAYYNMINEAGESVDIMPAIETALAQGKTTLRKAPGAKEHVAKMEDWVLNYMDEGQYIPVDLASEWKTSLYQNLPQSAYVPGTNRALPPANDFQKAFARGIKSGIEDAGERVAPGVGKAIASVNEDIGSIIQARNPIMREVRKANTKDMVSSVDGAGMAYAFAHPAIGGPVLAGKKLGDVAKTTFFRTKTGVLMDQFGRTYAPDILLRQGMIETNRPDKSPWEGL